jgi:hypothetical protein
MIKSSPDTRITAPCSSCVGMPGNNTTVMIEIAAGSAQNAHVSPSRFAWRLGCSRIRLSVPAAAANASTNASKVVAESSSVVGEPSARKLITVVGSRNTRLSPKPNTSTQVVTLMRSR